jgi:hypothetical protein
MTQQRQEQKAITVAASIALAARRAITSRGSVAQLVLASREPDASPSRNAPKVMAKAVALDPEA